MAEVHVRVPDETRRYSKTALLAPRMPTDRCRIDGRWYMAVDLVDRLDEPLSVEAVDHFQRHSEAVGDTIVIGDILGRELTRGIITEIVLTTKDLLTDADIHALGMQSLDDLYSGWAQTMSGATIWLTKFYHIIGEGNDGRAAPA
jgi:hypothetical protein